ncbi:MAG TPA: 5-guanidino-2-oxopentanoate decarboxylase [Propylenella sp.]|nr:5-guanidino-2-oxopentanoate decarboxylase [Propylenella sp.]
MRFGEFLVAQLERYGVRHVFGIPGVHTAELYRGLAGRGVRHITPRHEQGAGFMADGYARLSGRPGVCFVITGPGVTNIASAMAQAYQDSIPMLVISGVAATPDLGHCAGNLHELPDQHRLASSLTAFSHTLYRAEDLPAVLARAFALFGSARPRPVHIEVPLDVMAREVDEAALAQRPARVTSTLPAREALADAAHLLTGAERPVVLAGGGARDAGGTLVRLAERLEAPVVMTVNGRGLLPLGHPLAVPASPSLQAVRRLVEDSDVVLAIGTEIGRTDYDMYVTGGFSIPGRLARIEIDPVQMVRNRVPDVCLLGDSAATAAALLELVPDKPLPRDGANRAETARREAFEELSPAMRRQVEFLGEIRAALPGGTIVGDSTQPVYSGNLYHEAEVPAGWFNSATGYGTLGYALPAAIGAKLAAPERPVVCLVGDGGLQFALGELGSAIDAKTPVFVLVWNNRGYGEIKTYMKQRGIAPEGVDLAPPDFCAVARAYGMAAEQLYARADLTRLLQEATRRPGPTLIEIDEAVIMG